LIQWRAGSSTGLPLIFAESLPKAMIELVDGFFRALEARAGRGVDVGGEADQHCRKPDQAVHQRHQLRHLRHLHRPRGVKADSRAEHHGADDPGVGRLGHLGAERRGEDRDRHADHAVEVPAARRLGIGKPAEAEDEQDRRAEVGDREERGRHGEATSGTSAACAA
jgi:hypothetical protein